jgi:hypothetical protein
MSAIGEAFSKHPIGLSIIFSLAGLMALGTVGETIVNAVNKTAPRDMNCVVQQADQGSSMSPGATVALSCTPR